jgi:ribonuclease Z
VMTDRLFGAQGAFRPEMDTRIAPEFGVALYRARGVPEPFPPMVPDVDDLDSGQTIEIGPFTIRTTTAAHCQPYINSLAYRVDTATGSMVFTGDSAPSPAIQRLADGADLLLHDCNINKTVRAGLNGKGIHTSQEEVGRVAAAAKVGRLIIVHHGLASEQAPLMSDEVRKQFDGPITVAKDLDSFNTAA